MQKQAAMKMKSCTAAILLLISLQAVVDGSLSAVAVVGDDGGVDTIRLPSQGRPCGWPFVYCPHKGDGEDVPNVSAATADASPWKCCDLSRCTKSSPPSCTCLDKVKKCAKTCKKCEKAVDSNDDASSGYYCRDTYSKVAPRCTSRTVAALPCPWSGTKPGDDEKEGVATAEEEEPLPAMARGKNDVVDGEEGASPWKCCDKSWCTRSMPPICHCNDEVKKCAKNCKVCEKADKSKGAYTRYVCRDTYGKVAPQCSNKTVTAAEVRRSPAVSGDQAKAEEAATVGQRLLNSTDQFSTGKAEEVSEKSVVDGEEDASPWKCCDKSWCTRSMPPICHCNDEVKKCAKNCKVCEKADKSNAASTRYICRDSCGKAGPPCTKTVATDVSRGN